MYQSRAPYQIYKAPRADRPLGLYKGAYSNNCMQIDRASKLTKYITRIYEMRFLMRNYLKYTQQCQN